MDAFQFGNFLCRLREENNLSQAELGKLLGVSNKAVSKWENGEATPKLHTIEKLCEIFHVTADELISGKRKPSDGTAQIKLDRIRSLLAGEAEKQKRRNKIITRATVCSLIVINAVILIAMLVKLLGLFLGYNSAVPAEEMAVLQYNDHLYRELDADVPSSLWIDWGTDRHSAKAVSVSSDKEVEIYVCRQQEYFIQVPFALDDLTYVRDDVDLEKLQMRIENIEYMMLSNDAADSTYMVTDTATIESLIEWTHSISLSDLENNADYRSSITITLFNRHYTGVRFSPGSFYRSDDEILYYDYPKNKKAVCDWSEIELIQQLFDGKS